MKPFLTDRAVRGASRAKLVALLIQLSLGACADTTAGSHKQADVVASSAALSRPNIVFVAVTGSDVNMAALDRRLASDLVSALRAAGIPAACFMPGVSALNGPLLRVAVSRADPGAVTVTARIYLGDHRRAERDIGPTHMTLGSGDGDLKFAEESITHATLTYYTTMGWRFAA
ncbi:hypothetical protein [Acidomonas methanolica]|uniref:hypothetical protein n=1 Tax=Acidomonas methanolica TaxID=437 RepID=UPI00211A4507|nr:hypothetical protein [Acidomonas methanolica]MCQ9156858.1 hypothetical protein [Acidomonas methanolica]